MTDTPRVARSLDDLRVGQVVATICNDGSAGECIEFQEMYAASYADFMDGGGTVVILSDPPPVPLTLTPEAQEVLERLREAIRPGEHVECDCPGCQAIVAARSFLAAVDAGGEGNG